MSSTTAQTNIVVAFNVADQSLSAGTEMPAGTEQGENVYEKRNETRI